MDGGKAAAMGKGRHAGEARVHGRRVVEAGVRLDGPPWSG
jgi:hypothetical protein